MDNQDVGIELQNKFAFYLVALIFTILALSVETADFNGEKITDSAEILAWLFLLTSGLSGLRRLEIIPTIYRLASINPQGQGNEAKEKYDKDMQQKQDSAQNWYVAHKILFVLGLLSLFVSRGYEPIVNIFSSSC
jgi:hypothetical protein